MIIVPLSANLAAKAKANNLDPDVADWNALAAIPTFGLELPIVKIWIEMATGRRMVTRLLASNADTDTASGVQRPRDYDAATNARVWFSAG